MMAHVMAENTTRIALAREFASELGYDLNQDVQRLGLLPPHLVQIDPVNGPLAHTTDEREVDYYTARIDFGDDERIAASRVFAVVMKGAKTKPAYWPKNAQLKELRVLKGEGWLIIGNPDSEELDDISRTKMFKLDAEVTPDVTLQPGTFYVLEAASWSSDPLIVSGLSETDAEGQWEHTEILVEAGEEFLETPDGMVQVPEEFSTSQYN